MPLTTKIRFAPVLAIAAAVLVLTACGNKADKNVATQVAAKVGSDEISVHQINQVLSRANTAGVTPQNAQALRKEVLEKLIDQQLAVDQATENKLHRTPEVVAQIEAARREVLARAYVQQLTSGLPKPTPDEVKKYYTEHPQLFSERRIYNLQEMQVPSSAGAGVFDQVRSQVAAGKSIDEIAAFLKSKDIKFGGGSATRAAEQIPLELLSKLQGVRDGQTIALDNPQGLTVLRIASSQSAPVTEAISLPRVEQFLTNQRAADAVAQNLKQLRSKTTITYMGDFAQTAATAGAVVPSPAATATPPAATPVPPTAEAPAAAQGNTPSTDDKAKAAIEKGVAGLK
ncbi:MAG: EpsD family peptidyl-prolyl cis-trans isomerase [Burkholderiaceae bacterium]